MRVGHAFTFFAVAVHVVQVVLVVVFDTDDFSHIPVSRVVELCFHDLTDLCKSHEPNYQCEWYQNPINSFHNQLTSFLIFSSVPVVLALALTLYVVCVCTFCSFWTFGWCDCAFLALLVGTAIFLELCAFRFFTPLLVVIPNRYFLRSSQCSSQYFRSPAVCDMHGYVCERV